MAKVTFSKVTGIEDYRFVTIFVDGKNVGEIYRDHITIEWGVDLDPDVKVPGDFEDIAAGNKNLAQAKKMVKEAILEGEATDPEPKDIEEWAQGPDTRTKGTAKERTEDGIVLREKGFFVVCDSQGDYLRGGYLPATATPLYGKSPETALPFTTRTEAQKIADLPNVSGEVFFTTITTRVKVERI